MSKKHYRIRRKWCSGYSFYGYRVEKKQFLGWVRAEYFCGRDGLERAKRWIKDDLKDSREKIIYNWEDYQET